MPRSARCAVAFLFAPGFVLPAAWAGVSRAEAASLAQRAAPGRLLAVEHGVDLDNKEVWRARMLTPAGELRVVVIDVGAGRGGVGRLRGAGAGIRADYGGWLV